MKKNAILIIGSIVVVLAVTVALIFVFGDFGTAPESASTDLTGTWIVAATYTNDVPTPTQDQFMVFTDTNASMYVGDKETPYATSSYSINEAKQLILPDISREYKLDVKTENCIRLYESTSTYMLLIKNASAECSISPVDSQFLTGNWNIAMKGDQFNVGERMEFAENELKYYRSNSADPIVAEFSVENGTLTVASLGLTMQCYQVSEQVVIFIENSGIVWELTR